MQDYLQAHNPGKLKYRRPEYWVAGLFAFNILTQIGIKVTTPQRTRGTAALAGVPPCAVV